jgi:endonuclease YncB( thermonuclease family)
MMRRHTVATLMVRASTNREARRRRAAAAFLLGSVALWATMSSPAAAADACALTPSPSGRVRDVIDGRTLRLQDGRVIRLAGIDVPPDETPRGREARLFLAELLTDQPVVLKTDGAASHDRYGRVVAHVFTTDEGLERSLQAVMLDGGLARVAARVGGYGCATAFWAREQHARTARRGLWADPEATLSADGPSALLEKRGRFALVEGTVISVRESGGTIYVNFGRRWSEDFTVTIAKRNVRIFTAAGLAPQQLARRKIRVRGVVEERGGPWIEAMRPEQIEVLEYVPEKWDPVSAEGQVQGERRPL